MTQPHAITVAYGDGIGPEIMEATLKILDAAGAQLDIEEIEIGKAVYERGVAGGIDDKAWESLRRTHLLLKAPITTPQGGGYKSLNVTIRKSWGLFANVRPCVSYHPFVKSLHPDMNLVIVRENEEDLYAGIEYQQTDDVVQCLKLISREGCERIVRYAFDYAKQAGRKKVTCMSKDNIMKQADGLFHRIYDEIGEEYPDIEKEHMIIDIGSAKIASNPQHFDVVVTLNLYGDIISDIAAEVTGSVGLAGSANCGKHGAMFEAIHGSAPDIAGQGIANPSGLLLGGVMMLHHIGQNKIAEKVHNAWLRTIEDGEHTGDIYNEETSRNKLNTNEFTAAVIERLGEKPETLPAVSYGTDDGSRGRVQFGHYTVGEPKDKKLLGVDIFLHWLDKDGTGEMLADRLKQQKIEGLELKVISCRGLKIWPDGIEESETNDNWCCRFMAEEDGAEITKQLIMDQLAKLDESGFDFVKTENLYSFDGDQAFSVAQGQ